MRVTPTLGMIAAAIDGDPGVRPGAEGSMSSPEPRIAGVDAGADDDFRSITDPARLARSAASLRAAGRTQRAADAFARIAALVPADWIAQYNSGAVFLEAGDLGEAARAFARSVALHPSAAGFVSHAHALALLGDIRGARDEFGRAAVADPANFDAHWGLFEVNQLLDDNAAAIRHQQLALAIRSLVTIEARVQPAQIRLLELCVAGTFQANIPLDFIIDRDRVTVHKLYVGQHPIPALPAYDVVFNTIADAPGIDRAVAAARAFAATTDRPVLNRPELVGLTSRDSIADIFRDSASVAVAPLRRAGRAAVGAVRPAFPFLIRPLDSHAGNDLAKIDDDGALQHYLATTQSAHDFYLSDFIDYRNADGFYRKYRIVFVDGVAYPVHLAISPRWMIHYYNAPMAEHAWMRDEEHAFMRDMDSVFDGIRAAGLHEIARKIPLDYFGIDCSIATDGRVLLFEASAAMIVHMRDPVDLYPYKARYVPRIVRALASAIERRAASGAAR